MNASSKFVTLTFALIAVSTLGSPIAEAQDMAGGAAAPANSESTRGNLVMFLTQTDPMVAGHALHFASRMAAEGRPSTVILVGEAGRLGLTGYLNNRSAVTGEDLQTALQEFISAGGRVFITPPTLASYNADIEALIEGVDVPRNPSGVHAHMFDANTQLVVW